MKHTRPTCSNRISQAIGTSPFVLIYEIKEDIDLRIKIDALTKKVDVLAVDQSINAANTFNVDSHSICASPMHLAQNCPSMPAFAKYPMEQVNAFNDYRKQSNGPYSETYNLGLRNHQNFSGKQNHLVNQGGTPHHAHNQYPPKFPPQIPSNGCSAHPAPSPTYQATTPLPVLVSQSLEDTLKDFMKMIGQSISEVRSATIVNTKAIVKLES